MSKVESITKVALFSSLTAIGAQICIPIGTVPITLQVLFVLLSGMLLTPRLALFSQLVYLLMGALGLPVFAGFKGGVAHLYGPTAGYLWSFPIASMLVSVLGSGKKGYLKRFFSSFLGLGMIYLLGWWRLALFMNGDFYRAFQVGVLPFIGVDIAKAVLAVVIAERLRVLVTARQKA
ncbi:MAG: biotin transporter BioY [Synergistetes bacterium]|nr:biotin transporter BioY [Synergistota bacterium]MCX8127798.1 biotin transporter BioY [Synergistota bacterium]MDW8192060.1 biotin transporter BioY [Synergistota bacterium]